MTRGRQFVTSAALVQALEAELQALEAERDHEAELDALEDDVEDE